LSDLGVFEVRSEKPAMNLPALGVSDLWSARLPPIMKKKIIIRQRREVIDGGDRLRPQPPG
jgi:hypothetical protein